MMTTKTFLSFYINVAIRQYYLSYLNYFFFLAILTAIKKRPMAMVDIRNQVLTFPWLASRVTGG